jgi:hypothetical protein
MIISSEGMCCRVTTVDGSMLVIVRIHMFEVRRYDNPVQNLVTLKIVNQIEFIHYCQI